jgi:plastocyanin
MARERWPRPRSLSTTRNRRQAVQAVAAAAGGLLIARAGVGGAVPVAIAQGDEDDDSGHGRGRGRGRGGDDPDSSGSGNRDNEVLVQTTGIPPGSIEVRIVSDDADGFIPGELTIDAGQSVTFVNAHSDEHTATGSGFDTGIIPSGAIATVVLDEPGRFAYACMIHPEMTGIIAVRGPDGVVPQQAQEAAVPSHAIPVRIANLAFDPSALTVQTGATVVWSNDDSVPHTVTSLDGLFDSAIFDPGATFSWTFDQPGAFAYQCQLHPSMQGSVVAEGVAVAAATPAAAADQQPSQDVMQAAPVGDVPVSIVDFAFEPGTLEIAAGATVVWTNDGQAPHTVTGEFADSGILQPGQTFSHTFDDKGTFDYACALHPQMVGQVVVGVGVAASPQPAAASSVANVIGVWVLELEPEAEAVLPAHQALLALHPDGAATASFAALPEADPSAMTLDSAQGAWSGDGDGLTVSLLALLVDSSGRFAGTATIDIHGRIGPNGTDVDGTFAISPRNSAGDQLGERGAIRGELARIGP